MIFSCTLLFKNDLQTFIANVEVAIAYFYFKRERLQKIINFSLLKYNSF